MKYEVTIGVPVYNVEKYIRQMMDSALAQTFQNIEFLICDDCGTDRSIDIVREYQQTHPRGKDIRIVRQPQNMGIGAGRNRLVDEAQGRYIYFMDADDTIASDTIEILYQAAQQYQAQLVYGSYERIVDIDEETRRKPFQYPAMQFAEEDAFANYVYRKYDGIQAMIWNVLIDINVYRENHLRHQFVNYWEDFTFTMDLPTYVTRVVLLPDVTYSYYCHNGSLSHFQQRDHISKEEIQKTIDAVSRIKANSDRIRHKSYFPRRMYKVMMTDFYIIDTILKQTAVISPSFGNSEIKDIMHSPLTCTEILRFRQARMANMLLFLLGKLPASLMIALVKLLVRIKTLFRG